MPKRGHKTMKAKHLKMLRIGGKVSVQFEKSSVEITVSIPREHLAKRLILKPKPKMKKSTKTT